MTCRWRRCRRASRPTGTAWHRRQGPCPIRGSCCAPAPRPGRPRPSPAGTGTVQQTWCGGLAVPDQVGGHPPIAHDGAELVGSLLVTASRQFGEALFLEDRGDRRRAERLAVAGEGASDIVDGEVLLPERDDLLAQPFLLAGGPSLARAGGRIRGGVDGGTDGRERESLLGCSRSGRPPEPRGAPRRSRPVRLRTGDEWSWRARGTGEPKLVDL